MHHRTLLDRLDGYLVRHPEEAQVVQRFQDLLRAEPGCFERSCLPGHITASAWIASHDGRHFLLTRHRKLDRWLQLGGHADGDVDLFRVALREAREESGMLEFERVPPDGDGTPLDLDVHRIPAWGRDPEHEHYDVRFLLRAKAGQPLRRSEESLDLRWIPVECFEDWTREPSLSRMGQKALARLAGERG